MHWLGRNFAPFYSLTFTLDTDFSVRGSLNVTAKLSGQRTGTPRIHGSLTKEYVWCVKNRFGGQPEKSGIRN